MTCRTEAGDELDLHDRYGIVVEDGGHVFGRKLIGGVADEKTGLANSTVSDHNTSGVAGIRQQFSLGKGSAERMSIGLQIFRLSFREMVDIRHDG